MITAILIVLILLIMAIIGFLYVISVHHSLTKEFKDKEWMDNSEYDYGHDVHYTEEHLF